MYNWQSQPEVFVWEGLHPESPCLKSLQWRDRCNHSVPLSLSPVQTEQKNDIILVFKLSLLAYTVKPVLSGHSELDKTKV